MLALAFPAVAAGWLLLYAGFKGADPREEFIAAFQGTGRAPKRELFTDGTAPGEVGLTRGSQIINPGPMGPAASAVFGGKRAGLKPMVLDELKIAEESYGLHLTSGCRPGAITSSNNPSLHSVCQAIDVSGSTTAMAMYAQFVAGRPGVYEVIYAPLGLWKAGIGWTALSPTSQLYLDHIDHVHVGVTA